MVRAVCLTRRSSGQRPAGVDCAFFNRPARRSSPLTFCVRRYRTLRSARMKTRRELQHWVHAQQRHAGMRVSVGWYTEQQWANVKAAAVDPERFEETYDQWVEVAEDALAKLHSAGVNAAKCNVVADELLFWCLAHGKPNDAASRAQYVSEQGQGRV